MAISDFGSELLTTAMLQRFNSIAPQGILLTDTELIVRGWNPWLEEHSGRTAREMIGQKLLEAFPELVTTRKENFYRAALAGQVRVLSQRLHGYLLPLPPVEKSSAFPYMQQSAWVAPITQEDLIVGTVTLIDDVTERVEQEAALQRLLAQEQAAREEAEIANRLKDQFLATVSHELRTPLSAILGWAQLLRAGRLDSTGMSRAVEAIVQNSRIQAQLIDDLLDVGRIITGKLRLDVRPVQLRPIINAALDTVRPALEAKAIEVGCHFEATDCVVIADPDRMQQVFWNLLANAAKFTPRGGSIEVRQQTSEALAQILITDTGQGISPEFLPFVFDRFRQADASPSRRHSGLGLGLSIVRHLVEAHGGSVQAESQGIGHGSTFIVKIPLGLPSGLKSANAD